MLTRRLVLTACLGIIPAGSVFAQATSDGTAVPSYPTRPSAPTYDDDDEDYGISRREAVRIARRRGIVDVDDVRRRRGVWIVRGTDDDGDDIRVIINNEGYVVDVRRD